ncbi:MAG: hypothetical protein M3Q80_01045 [bacterium]|nr:hypothetical protein [bacterium]
MLVLKSHEVRSGHPTIVSRLGRRSDNFFHTIFHHVHVFISYINKHTFIALAHWIAFHILVHIRKLYVEIKARALATPHGKKIINAVRGRGEVKDHGASFYLRRISDK